MFSNVHKSSRTMLTLGTLSLDKENSRIGENGLFYLGQLWSAVTAVREYHVQCNSCCQKRVELLLV